MQSECFMNDSVEMVQTCDLLVRDITIRVSHVWRKLSAKLIDVFGMLRKLKQSRRKRGRSCITSDC